MNTRDDVPHFQYRDMDYFFRKKRFFGKGPAERNVYAVFENHAAMEETIRHLRSEGFANDDIFLTKVRNGTLLDSAVGAFSIEPFLVPLGVAGGMLLGALCGWLAYFGNFSFFGIEPFVSSGPLSSAIATSIAWGFIGGILGILTGLTFLEYNPEKFETSYPEGTPFLVVRTLGDMEMEKARRVLNAHLLGADFAKVNDAAA